MTASDAQPPSQSGGEPGTEAPRARLAILQGTSHVGIMANADLITQVAIPFLDDNKPITPPGFFPEGK